MKKIFPVLVLISLFAVLTIPTIVSAQGVPECCKLGRKIDLSSGVTGSTLTCDKDKVVGAVLGACPGSNLTIDCAQSSWGVFCLLNTLYGVVDWIFVILIALSGLFIILGAMNLIMSAGDSSKVTTGRQYVMYAFIGLIVGLLARAIPSVVKLVVGV